jgi:solute carrier family 25 protein 39/40
MLAACPPLHIPSRGSLSASWTRAYSVRSGWMGFTMPSATFGGPRVFEASGRALGRHCESCPVWVVAALLTYTWHLFSIIGVPSSTAYMVTYDYLLRQVLPTVIPFPSIVPLAAGVFARSIVSSVISPLELVRTNLQSTPSLPNTPHTLKSVLSSLEGLVRTHGVRHLWRGLEPTLWRDVPFSGLYWASYEGMKGRFEKRGRSGPSVAFICGATSGTVAALLTSPFDVLKTRRQALVMSTPGQRTSALPFIQQIIRTEGVSALFAGLGPRIAKIAPACGIMIACYEVCLWLLPSQSDSSSRPWF